MQIGSDKDLEFLDLKLKIIEGQIKVERFLKPAKGKKYETEIEDLLVYLNTLCQIINVINT